MSRRPGPPRLARWILWRLLPAEEREYGLGDFAESHASMVRSDGRRAADRWYRWQVVRSVVPLLTIDGWRPEGTMAGGIERDASSALRQFRRNPGFAAVVVGTIAVGVGVATAVYGVLDGVVRKPLPLPESERVVTLWGQSSEYPRAPLTVGDHNALANDVEAFESVSAAWSNTALLLGEGGAEQVAVGWVTPEYFPMLGLEAQIGRLPGPDDENAVVIAHDLWVRRYGSDPGVMGRMVDVAGAPMEVIGVLRAADDPNLTSFAGGRGVNRVWRLQPAEWTRGEDRSVGWLRSSARLRDGVSVAAAQAEVDALMERINRTVTDRDGGADLRVLVRPVREDLTGDVSRTLWMLLAAVCGVLLIASTNVANLMLARGQTRTAEVAVRAALGGSRFRIFRQLLIESGALAVAGGAAGIGVAWAATKALVAAAPATLPRVEEAGLGGSVLLFALGATTVAVLVFGVIPALRVSRSDLARAMGRRTATVGRREQRLNRALVVVQVALSLCLVAGTGLLVRSLRMLEAAELGFDREGLLTFSLETPGFGQTAEESAALLREYIGNVEDEPVVLAAAVTNRVPLAGGLYTGRYRSEDMVASDADGWEASYRFVTPRYFDAMGARLLAGRSFTASDGLEVTIVDAQVASRLWPGQAAVGRRLEHTFIGADPTSASVIGVVSPMKHGGVAEESPPTVFLPMLAVGHQQNTRNMVVRVAGDPLAAVDGIRAALRRVDPNAVMARVRPMKSLYDDSTASTRFAGRLLGAFGGVALLLAAIGLHGVLSLTVRRRTREFGVRVALGAGHGAILKDVLGSGIAMVLAGTAIGLLMSLVLARFLTSMLFGVRPADPVAFATAAALILGVGLLSAWIPARRVRRLDPLVALSPD